jgi:transcriptional regulator with XRE-family HTH domain
MDDIAAKKLKVEAERNVGEIERNVGVFARNLDRLMTRRGIRNSTLAQIVGVSREMVSVWRQGKSLPAPERGDVLARALNCTEAELFEDVADDLPPMLPIAQWAKRENIPVGRAKSLFERGILSSDDCIIGDDDGVHLVPVQLRAPPNSKHLVRVAQRPAWVMAFAVNLDGRMREMSMQNSEMAEATSVGQCAVTHWRSGRGYPLTKRLPLIADKLGCTVDDLLAEPIGRRVTNWKFRFGHAWQASGEQIETPEAA